ncbi:MAG: carbamoyltransferase HypF [Candidatus Binatia bacterium]
MTETVAPGGAACGVRFTVRGQVQGVGFRPFVLRLARRLGLAGGVRNGCAGVEIDVAGTAGALAAFRAALAAEGPVGARIDAVDEAPLALAPVGEFTIESSGAAGVIAARVPPDLGTCPTCARELHDPADRRHGYPFTTCTACGPRFSVIARMPYDRDDTAMRRFTPCARCAAEYRSPADRRLHAETIACAACGPAVVLWDTHRQVAGPNEAVSAAAEALRRGAIVAVKGLGGFQLLVRADDAEAVARLRARKRRPAKPLAVMVPSLAAAERLASLAPRERDLLASPTNPIVLVTPRPGAPLAPGVAPHVGLLGLMLPTTPLHHLLLDALGLPVVATSGNASEEPIVVDEGRAREALGGIADAFLVHDRPVVRRVDDAVLRVIAGRAVTVRCARGTAPLALPGLERAVAGRPPMLATGGHEKAAVALWTGAQAVLGPHVGDLDGPQARRAYDESVAGLERLYGATPAALACDLHPDYHTTAWAAARGLPVTAVAHHHAHAVACMVEHGLLDREVLAFTWDGTGWGSDGTVWGGEVLRARGDGFARVGHLRPFPLPGGAAAIRHPARVAFALLDALGCPAEHAETLGIDGGTAAWLTTMIRRRMRTPTTTSVGRLFDAVAALALGVRAVLTRARRRCG